jgi:hypothetical protein
MVTAAILHACNEAIENEKSNPEEEKASKVNSQQDSENGS